MRQIDVDGLTDYADQVWSSKSITVPGAVWVVLKKQKLASRPDARELARQILANMQRRSVAKRLKNKAERLSSRLLMQLDDALLVIAERGGDPND